MACISVAIQQTGREWIFTIFWTLFNTIVHKKNNYKEN